LLQFAAHGTTKLEARAAYGLEMKANWQRPGLLGELHQEQPLDIHSTFLGAHVVPSGVSRRANAYVDFLIEKMILAWHSQACRVL